MSSQYRLDFYDLSGIRQAVVTDFLNLAYIRRVNAPGLLEFELNGWHRLLTMLQDRWRVQVWRKPTGGAWRKESTFIYRDMEWRHEETPVWSGACVGLLGMLGERIVAWKAGINNRSKFEYKTAEYIAKSLANYNAGPQATTANGRLVDGAISGLAAATWSGDGAGPRLDWFCAYDNLLDTLQKLAQVGQGDFDLVEDGGGLAFAWYPGQRGIDRTATVKFALLLGNMSEPTYSLARSGAPTLAVVGGKAEEEARRIAIRQGADYAATNHVERFVAATDVDTQAGLEARGDAALAEGRALEEFTFDVLQTPACQYAVHYDVGDLVTVSNPFNGASVTQKVTAVTVGLREDGAERVAVELATP